MWREVMWRDVMWREVMWSAGMWCEVRWCEGRWCEVQGCDVMWSEVMWSEVMWSEVMWCEVMWRDVKRRKKRIDSWRTACNDCIWDRDMHIVMNEVNVDEWCPIQGWDPVLSYPVLSSPILSSPTKFWYAFYWAITLVASKKWVDGGWQVVVLSATLSRTARRTT